MRDLAALVALHGDLDTRLESTRAAYLSALDEVNAQRIADRQCLNDQAYFVLCWGQLEAAIDDRCRRAIRKRQAEAAWQDRRAWDRYNPDDRRLSGLSFDERVALVTDCRGGRGSPWARIMNYYALRNQIAHGALISDRIDVAEVVEDFYTLLGALAD